MQPTDGYAYSFAQLAEIDDLPSTRDEAIEHLKRRAVYFRSIGENWLADLLLNTMRQEVLDPEPVDDHEDLLAEDGWIHGEIPAEFLATEDRPATKDE